MTAALAPAAHRCPPWCAHPHRPDDLPDDRVCLSEQPGSDIATIDRDIQVYTRHEHGLTTITLDVHAVTGGGLASELTTAEAEQLRDALTAELALARGRG